MKKIIIILIILGVIWGFWYFLSPLFIDKKVDESIPVLNIDENKNQKIDLVENKEEENEIEPANLRKGSFVDADSFHKGSGSAQVLKIDDEMILRLEDFEVTNGPDLYVVLSKDMDPTNPQELGDYLNLGELKGNIGNQNYQIPNNVNLSDYNSVVIYCKAFGVIFSVASLQ